eukprot:s670_g21.t1
MGCFEGLLLLLNQFPRSSEVANGKVCFRFFVDMQMSLDPCPGHFKSPDGWKCPGEVACIYHCTDLRVLTQPGGFCTGSRGILNDKALYTSSNGHLGRFGVFGHGSTQQAYMCLGREPTACFLELEANYLLVVQSGMRNRWVAPGTPRTPNRHCRLKAVWIRAPAYDTASPFPPMPPSPPPEGPASTSPPPASPPVQGLSYRCLHAYGGIEHCSESMTLESGYLALGVGDQVQILSKEEPGHEGNTFLNYVFAECRDQKGWVPSLLLGPADITVPLRWALIHDLQRARGRGRPESDKVIFQTKPLGDAETEGTDAVPVLVPSTEIAKLTGAGEKGVSPSIPSAAKVTESKAKDAKTSKTTAPAAPAAPAAKATETTEAKAPAAKAPASGEGGKPPVAKAAKKKPAPDMGFDETAATTALEASAGNLDQAVVMLSAAATAAPAPERWDPASPRAPATKPPRKRQLEALQEQLGGKTNDQSMVYCG